MFLILMYIPLLISWQIRYGLFFQGRVMPGTGAKMVLTKEAP